MAERKRHQGHDAEEGPRETEGDTDDSWSRTSGNETIPDLDDETDDRLAQMRHGDESAETERTTDKPATADFFEPLDTKLGEDARRADGE